MHAGVLPTPGTCRLYSAVNQWQPGPFAKLLWPLGLVITVIDYDNNDEIVDLAWFCTLYSEKLRTEKANELTQCDNTQRWLDDFHIVTTLGKGTYGQVYKAIDKPNRK